MMMSTKTIQKYMNTASILREEGKLDQAIEQYLLALEINPDYVPALFQLAETYDIVKKYDKALKFYQKVVEINPDNSETQAKLARVMMEQGNIQEAITAYEKAIAINAEQREWVYEKLGNALMENGQVEAALTNYKKAIEITSEENQSILNVKLAKILLKNNNTREAQKVVWEAIKYIPENNLNENILFSQLPIITRLKILLEAIASNNKSIKEKAVALLAASNPREIRRLKKISRKTFEEEVINFIDNKVLNILEIAELLAEEQQINLFKVLSVIGLKEKKDYYLNSLNQFLPKLNLDDLLLFYDSNVKEKIMEGNEILNVLAQYLDSNENDYEKAVCYSLFCFVLGKEEKLSLLVKSIKHKEINELNNQQKDKIIKNTYKIDYQKNLLVALASRLHTKAGTLHPFYPMVGYPINSLKIRENHPQIKGNKIKCAVCISGQLRGYKKAFPSLKKFIIEKLNADVFVHTWEDIGFKQPIPQHAYRVFSGKFLEVYQETLAKYVNYQQITKKYPSLFEKLTNQGKANLDSLKQFFGTEHIVIEDDNSPEFSNLSNSEKMYYKIWKCSELMKTYANDYDLVIRVRPDKPITNDRSIDWHKICEILKSQPLVYCDACVDIHSELVVGDQFAFGNMKIMEIYASVYKTHDLFQENFLFGAKLVSHAPLAYRFWLNNIQVERTPLNFGRLENASLTNQEIWECLKTDIEKRKRDEVDQMLLKAIELDLENE